MAPGAPKAGRGGGAAGLHLEPAALARLMPMHLVLSPAGRVRQAGPTMRRFFAHGRLIGRSLFTLFEVRGPHRITSPAGLLARAGHKLHLVLRGGAAEVPPLRLRGLAVPLAGDEGFLVNLSFGIDIVPAVGLLQLSDGDFAATDMTMELLYLAEANAAVMGEMRALSQRLDGARLQAEEEALTDPLTGLRNRRACDSFLARLCREGAPFALLHIDLDHFKQVNDSLGHAAGDKVLKHVAGVLRGAMAASDCIARVGGDEFVAILPGTAGEARLRALGEAIVAGAQLPVRVQGRIARVSASVGATTVPRNLRPDPAQVLAQSDSALYAAKAAGRGRVVLARDLIPGDAGRAGGTAAPGDEAATLPRAPPPGAEAGATPDPARPPCEAGGAAAECGGAAGPAPGATAPVPLPAAPFPGVPRPLGAIVPVRGAG